VRRLLGWWRALRAEWSVLQNAPSPAARYWYAQMAGDLPAMRAVELEMDAQGASLQQVRRW
jgi:hypothetical protein